MTQQKRLVVVTQRFFDEATITYLQQNNCEVRIADLPPGQADGGLSEQELIDCLRNADGWIVGHAHITASLLKMLPKLQIIARRGVGFERVDTVAVETAGKVATIAVGGNDACVADHALALMLSLGHRVRESQLRMNDGAWNILLGTDLFQKTVGIVGLGRIGRNVVQRLKGFETKVLACSPEVDSRYAEQAGIEYVDMDTLLAQSDYVTLHAPLTDDTRFLIDANAIRRMKTTAFVINTARGGLVEDRDLLTALKEGRLAGAGLDVFMSESDSTYASVTSELIALPNVIATPHSGASTREGLDRTNMVAAQCVVAVLDGRSPPRACIIVDGRRSG